MGIAGGFTGARYVQYDPIAAFARMNFPPEVPQGTFNNVGNKNPQDTGVQIFAASYAPNIYGSPFESAMIVPWAGRMTLPPSKPIPTGMMKSPEASLSFVAGW